MVYEKYTEFIDLKEEKNKQYNLFVVIGDIRFFVFQIVIVSLQHLNRTQSLLVLIIDLVYFCYFFRVLLTTKIFKSKIIMIKQVVQEICILIFISTITLFSFTEKSKFASSMVYKWIEYVTIASIMGACGAEFLMIMTELVGQLFMLLKNLCKRSVEKKKRGQIEQRAKGQKEDQEVFKFEIFDEFEVNKKKKKESILEKSKISRKQNLGNRGVHINPGSRRNGRNEAENQARAPVEGHKKIPMFGNENKETQKQIDISIRKQQKNNRRIISFDPRFKN